MSLPEHRPPPSRFGAVKRSPVRLSQGALVQTGYLDAGVPFPLVVRPGAADVNLATWAASNRPFLEGELRKHGAILFRGFAVDSIPAFRQVAEAVAPHLITYGERSSPRTELSKGVYTSTDHPPDQPIVLHNEQSYTLNWPMKIFFYCAQPAVEGGRTPIADSRKIYNRLSPGTVGRFRDKQIRYVRNYGDGLGLPWQEVFQTADRAAAEDYCRRAAIEFAWKGGDRLRTWQVRPAVRNHPRTGEAVWFNHALFFNVASLEPAVRDAMRAVVGDDDLPTNTSYGDGTPIEPAALDEIREAYRQETVSFPWHQGDVLLLDNMLACHGREPFRGPRKVVAAMAEPVHADTAEEQS